MSRATGEDLVERARRHRHVHAMEYVSRKDVNEVLQKVQQFLQLHETHSKDDCTHVVLGSYLDWWMGSGPTFKLCIVEDNTVDTLHCFICTLFDLGIPLTLAEKPTASMCLFQDVEIWGTATNMLRPEELIHESSRFLEMMGKIIGTLFRQSELLYALIFDASGFSRMKGIMKTSIRLVWPRIIVDKRRAQYIRDYAIVKFKDTRDEQIRTLFDQMQSYTRDNSWNLIFNDKAYVGGRDGVRMPFCDRVSPAPYKILEKRPFVPFQVIRFKYEEIGIQEPLCSIESLCGPAGLPDLEWLRMGSVRRDAGMALTEWSPPEWRGVRKMHVPSNPTSSISVGKMPGRARVRTFGGSLDGSKTYSCARPHKAQPKEESQRTLERDFDGTLAEFRDMLEKMLGCQAEDFHQDDHHVVWQKPGDIVHIEMKASNQRVFITGKTHQLRSIAQIIAPFVKSAGNCAPVAAATSAAQRQQGSASPSAAPSQVYAPRAVYHPPGHVFSPQPGVFASLHSAGLQHTVKGQRRMTVKVFKAQGQNELELMPGDIVTVTHDSEESSVHRWVFGVNEKTEQGWFCLSHTIRASEPQVEQPDAI